MPGAKENSFGHEPVLAAEALDLLAPKPGEVYLDCTAGLGGHAAMVAEKLGPTGTVVLNDLDAGNLARATETLKALDNAPAVHALHGPFDEAPAALAELGLRADTVLADLGFASSQVDDPDRGLSFKRDGALDMRLDTSAGMSAADIVAHTDEEELANLIYQYGEERHSRRIAKRIVETRKQDPIDTTAKLAELVRLAVPRGKGHQRIDPATRTFQALRIAVNDEIGRLERLLAAVTPDSAWLSEGARVAVIAFHSLEDRPVKQAFRTLADAGHAERLTRKPVIAGETETMRNPRARSAKLRAIKIR